MSRQESEKKLLTRHRLHVILLKSLLRETINDCSLKTEQNKAPT